MRIQKLFLYSIVLILTLIGACGKTKEEKEISEWVGKGALIVDVRTPNEYAREHYPGAINIPIQSLPLRLEELGSKEKEIILYCQSGGRSSKAKSFLNGEGFSNVIDAGGIQNLFSAASDK